MSGATPRLIIFVLSFFSIPYDLFLGCRTPSPTTEFSFRRELQKASKKSLVENVMGKGCSFGPVNDKGSIYRKKLALNLSYPTSESKRH